MKQQKAEYSVSDLITQIPNESLEITALLTPKQLESAGIITVRMSPNAYAKNVAKALLVLPS